MLTDSEITALLQDPNLNSATLNRIIIQYFNGQVGDVVSRLDIVICWQKKCQENSLFLLNSLPILFQFGQYWEISASCLSDIVKDFEKRRDKQAFAIKLCQEFRVLFIGNITVDHRFISRIKWLTLLLAFPTIRDNFSHMELRKIVAQSEFSNIMSVRNVWNAFFSQVVQYPSVWRKINDCDELPVDNYLDVCGYDGLNQRNISQIFLFGPRARAHYFVLYSSELLNILSHLVAQKSFQETLPTIIKEIVLIIFLVHIKTQHHHSAKKSSNLSEVRKILQKYVSESGNQSPLDLFKDQNQCVQEVFQSKGILLALKTLGKVSFLIRMLFHLKVTPELFSSQLPSIQEHGICQDLMTYAYIYCAPLRPVLMQACWIDRLDIYKIHAACTGNTQDAFKFLRQACVPIDFRGMQQALIKDYPLSAKLIIQLTTYSLARANQLARLGMMHQYSKRSPIVLTDLKWVLTRHPDKIRFVVDCITTTSRLNNNEDFRRQWITQLYDEYQPSKLVIMQGYSQWVLATKIEAAPSQSAGFVSELDRILDDPIFQPVVPSSGSGASAGTVHNHGMPEQGGSTAGPITAERDAALSSALESVKFS